MLKSFLKIFEVIDFIGKVKELCLRGGFNPAEFICNDDIVLI